MVGVGGNAWGTHVCQCPTWMLWGPNLLPVCCQGGSRATPWWHHSPDDGANPSRWSRSHPASQSLSQDTRCFLPAAIQGASLPPRAHTASVARAWPEASGPMCPQRSLRAPDGDAGVFPASFLLSAVALAFCTAGPKCVFNGLRAQRWMGRGCSWVLLWLLGFSSAIKLPRFGTDPWSGSRTCPRPSKQRR